MKEKNKAILDTVELSLKAIQEANHESTAIINDINRDTIEFKKTDKMFKIGQVIPGIKIPHKVKVKTSRGYEISKRAFDIFNSLLALIVLSPLMIVIGILVVTTSKGPMFYVSKRVGKDGKVFRFYKFRSMKVDAEAHLQELLKQNEVEGGVTFKIKNDPRITKFGHFIRRTSIDELPQLFNILKGDMSIIGPRAALPTEVLKYDERALDRLQVPQGLSGEWQVNGRSSTTFQKMIDMDLDYIENKRSFFYDIKIIFKTIRIVLTGKGAE